jgi:hypothetical protein
MGWLYMQSLNGHSGPSAYLDDQFTYARDGHRSKVLRSALPGKRTYYAAIEHVRPDDTRIVFAAVCLVRYNPRDREGYIFGYKDMDESMGPCESGCPQAILDLLTPTDSAFALEWRARCRANATRRKALLAKPKPRPGLIIVFDTPIPFRNGRTLDRFEVVQNWRGGRTMIYRDPIAGGLYRIPNVKARDYRLEATG